MNDNITYMSTVVLGFTKDCYSKVFKKHIKDLKKENYALYERVTELIEYATKIKADQRVFVYWQEILWNTEKDPGVRWINGFVTNTNENTNDGPSMIRIGLGKEGDIERLYADCNDLNLNTMTTVDFDDIHMYEYNATFKGNAFVATPMN